MATIILKHLFFIEDPPFISLLSGVGGYLEGILETAWELFATFSIMHTHACTHPPAVSSSAQRLQDLEPPQMCRNVGRAKKCLNILLGELDDIFLNLHRGL